MDGMTARARGMQRIAYSFGNFGQTAFYNVLSTYFVLYVTQAMFTGVDKDTSNRLIGIITGLIVVIRFAEIFLDPLLGNLVDNTNTKWGRFKPWQLIGGVVSAVLLVVVYSGLFGLVNVNPTLFIILFVIVFILLDVFYSLRDISYWGMVPALASDSHERAIYTSLGNFGGGLGYNLVTVAVVPIVAFFTMLFTGKEGQGPAGWLAFAVIAAVVGILSCMAVAFGTKESTNVLRTKAKGSGGPIQAFKAIFSNDQLLWMALAYLLYAVVKTITTANLMLLFKYVLDADGTYWIVGIIAMVTGFVMVPFYPVINRYVPRRILFLVGMVLMAAAYLVFIFSSDGLPMVIAALILFYVPDSLISTTSILTITDSIEYGQLKNGRRNEAVVLAVRPMLDKIAGAVSNGLVGWITVAAGMVSGATAADMTAENIATFKMFSFTIPLFVIVLSFLVFFFFVKLSEKRHAEIVAELTKRLNDGE